MKTLKTCVLIILSFIAFNDLSAQDKWSIEFRPGVNLVTQDLGDTELKTGFGAEFALGYRFMENLGVYVV